jgi:hypothetical protein
MKIGRRSHAGDNSCQKFAAMQIKDCAKRNVFCSQIMQSEIYFVQKEWEPSTRANVLLATKTRSRRLRSACSEMIRLKATIFLCIRSLAQMELFAPLFVRRY